MKYLIIIFFLLLLPACANQVSNNNDLGLQIDIYKKDMTFESFKQQLIEYADIASYPSLIEND